MKYGAEGKYFQKTLQGTFTCDNEVFGDPVPGTAKACFAKSPGYVPPEGQAPAAGTKLAEQGKPFQVGAPTLVSFGRATTTGGQYLRDSARVEKVVTGSGVCSAEFFGKDPAPGFAKNCFSYGAAPSTPAPPVVTPPNPPTTPPTSPVGADIVDAQGNVVQSAYQAMAMKLTTDEGVQYRFGSPASKTGIKAMQERPDKGTMSGIGSVYQLGTENDTNNMYVSIHAAAIGVPVQGRSVKSAVAWFQQQATDRRTFQQRPQMLWQDRRLLPPSVIDYLSQGVLAADDEADLPVCEHRAENAADSPATRLSLVCTRGSASKPATLFTVGTYTAQNRASMKFHLGFTPTAIAVTGGGEFALVSGWNWKEYKGQIVVVSLGAGPEGWKLGQPRYDWWHGWMDGMKPGFVDQGNYVFMKPIGVVDLPFKAPTSIVATTGIHPYTSMLKYDSAGHISSFQLLASPMAAHRTQMLPGGEDYERYAKGGIAIVASKSEKRVAFIDLAPLFKYTNDMYLGSAASNLETQNVGLAANQWPYPLADKPQAMPVVVKTETLAKRPSALWIMPTRSSWGEQERIPGAFGPPFFRQVNSKPTAAVATEDGDLIFYGVGRYAPGVKPTQPVPADIEQVGSMSGIGDNITHLAAAKDYPGEDDPINQMILFTDRANRAWGWVKLTVNDSTGAVSGTVLRRMADAGIDPIMVTMADNYSTKGNVVSVADYSGAGIVNYRFGDVIYPDRNSGFCTAAGQCPTLEPVGERAGKLSLPFKPTHIHGSNVP